MKRQLLFALNTFKHEHLGNILCLAGVVYVMGDVEDLVFFRLILILDRDLLFFDYEARFFVGKRLHGYDQPHYESYA